MICLVLIVCGVVCFVFYVGFVVYRCCFDFAGGRCVLDLIVLFEVRLVFWIVFISTLVRVVICLDSFNLLLWLTEVGVCFMVCSYDL